MNLSISSIAWTPDLMGDVAALLQACGMGGVELAPTQVFPNPVDVTRAEIDRCRRFWEDRGIRIVALQALLFGRPNLQIFSDAATREKTFGYLAAIIRLGGALGAESLVFGSPKNRRLGTGGAAAAWDIAVPFFRRLGEVAADHHIWFCIEPNPVAYGCDFVTTAAEGLALVREVNQPGFGLHLDAAGMTLSDDPALEIMLAAGAWWRHFHVSEPNLVPLADESSSSRHYEFAAAIEAAEYRRWLSIEMKTLPRETGLSGIVTALDFCQRRYAAAARPMWHGKVSRTLGASGTLHR